MEAIEISSDLYFSVSSVSFSLAMLTSAGFSSGTDWEIAIRDSRASSCETSVLGAMESVESQSV